MAKYGGISPIILMGGWGSPGGWNDGWTSTPRVTLSNASVFKNATIGTTVGVLSTASTTGTYTYSLTSNPGGLFAISGSNLNTATAQTVGSYSITVQASGGVPTPISQAFLITVVQDVPVNAVLPVISGTPTAGNVLAATTGTWAGATPFSYTYLWYQGVTPIGGATSSSYVLAPIDIGEMIACVVKATNSFGNASAASNSLGPIAASGTGPTAPVMAMDAAWTSADATPDFSITVDNTIVAGDSLRLQIQLSGGGWTAPVDDMLHVITGGEDSANLITLATGPLSNGSYQARTFVIDTVTGASLPSNVVPFTVTAVSAVSTYYILGF